MAEPAQKPTPARGREYIGKLRTLHQNFWLVFAGVVGAIGLLVIATHLSFVADAVGDTFAVQVNREPAKIILTCDWSGGSKSGRAEITITRATLFSAREAIYSCDTGCRGDDLAVALYRNGRTVAGCTDTVEITRGRYRFWKTCNGIEQIPITISKPSGDFDMSTGTERHLGRCSS